MLIKIRPENNQSIAIVREGGVFIEKCHMLRKSVLVNWWVDRIEFFLLKLMQVQSSYLAVLFEGSSMLLFPVIRHIPVSDFIHVHFFPHYITNMTRLLPPVSILICCFKMMLFLGIFCSIYTINMMDIYLFGRLTLYLLWRPEFSDFPRTFPESTLSTQRPRSRITSNRVPSARKQKLTICRTSSRPSSKKQKQLVLPTSWNHETEASLSNYLSLMRLSSSPSGTWKNGFLKFAQKSCQVPLTCFSAINWAMIKPKSVVLKGS